MGVKVGDKIYIPNNKKSWKVMARDERFIICMQSYNPKRTWQYFIVDLERQLRGPDNLVFTIYDYGTEEGCQKALKALQSGDLEVSRRRSLPLDIDVE